MTDKSDPRALVERYTEFARRDDCLDRMVPSDLRVIVGALTVTLARAEKAEAAIKRQAGAARTLREITLAEVADLKARDRANYIAPAVIAGEREANALLSAEIERLEAACKEWADVSQANYQRAKNAEAEVERLRIALANIDVGEGWAALIARAALEEQK